MLVEEGLKLRLSYANAIRFIGFALIACLLISGLVQNLTISELRRE